MLMHLLVHLLPFWCTRSYIFTACLPAATVHPASLYGNESNYCCCMTACCHIEKYSVPLQNLTFPLSKIMHRMGLILYSARFILRVRRSALFINIHPRLQQDAPGRHSWAAVLTSTRSVTSVISKSAWGQTWDQSTKWLVIFLQCFCVAVFEQSHSGVVFLCNKSLSSCVVLIKDYYISNCGGNK